MKYSLSTFVKTSAISGLLAFTLSSCTTLGHHKTPANAGQNPALLHHSNDTKGSNTFPMTRRATGRRVFIYNPRHTAWAAYDASGDRMKTGRASGGAAWCGDVGRSCRTVRGQFRVYSKGNADCKSSKFPLGKGGAPMPHCMFFHKGYAIHGSYSVPNHNASHGCIRVTPSAAQWLNQNFMKNGTTVIVKPY
jgi:lipoprotein-anchoring transpeptidase ErfK/SrfK